MCVLPHRERQGKEHHTGAQQGTAGHFHSHGRGSAACGDTSSLQKRHIRCSLQYLLICRDKEGKGECREKEKQLTKNEE